ncbi:GWxTD domain-containing protein, partial [bacterium]|nr:GWxTD domain-containing protein [bacterium]
LTLRLPHASLIFTRSGSGQLALYEYRVRIVPAEDSAGMVDEVFADSLRVRQPPPKDAQTLTTRTYRLAPGSYRVDVEMTDLNTGGTALRSQRAEVFALSDGCAHISRFRIFQRARGLVSPYLPFYIPADAESLEAVARVYNPRAVLGRKLSAALITYRTDTALASPPHYFSPTAWDLSYRGVAFHRPETVWVRSIRVLGDTTASIRFPFGSIPRGFYELVLEGLSGPCGEEDEPSPIRRHGYLAVFGPAFPRLTSIAQLIGPLAYFARPDEIGEILSAGTPEAQRSRFDRFWLRLAGSPESATNVIRQYYTRVEQANLLFSSYKEGWKTDKGMVYIVFGPPGYVD